MPFLVRAKKRTGDYGYWFGGVLYTENGSIIEKLPDGIREDFHLVVEELEPGPETKPEVIVERQKRVYKLKRPKIEDIMV